MRSWTFLTFQTPCLCEHTSVIISNIWISTNCACGCNITCMHFINIGGILCTFGGTHTFWRNSSAIYQFYNNIFKFKIQLFWGCNNIDSFLIRRFKKETFLFCSRLSADAAYGIDQDIDQRVYSAPVFPRSNWSLYESILFSEAFLFVLLSWYFHFILYYILLQLVTCQGPAATKRDDHLESSTTNIKDYNLKL